VFSSSFCPGFVSGAFDGAIVAEKWVGFNTVFFCPAEKDLFCVFPGGGNLMADLLGFDRILPQYLVILTSTYI